MTAKVIYQGQLRTQMTHLQSGEIVITDAPKDNHGKGEAFSPTDIVATALGSCMLSIMGIYAQQHGLDIEGTQVHITKHMASAPRRISKIEAKVLMPDGHFYTEKDKKALEKELRAQVQK
ncbi:MAG: OsmC family protein [Saprospiraceae bacterium]|nr:OsmC family protein [Saprospiraceae bacterium]